MGHPGDDAVHKTSWNENASAESVEKLVLVDAIVLYRIRHQKDGCYTCPMPLNLKYWLFIH